MSSECVHKLGVVTGLGKGQNVAVSSRRCGGKSIEQEPWTLPQLLLLLLANTGVSEIRRLDTNLIQTREKENTLLLSFGLVCIYIVAGTHVSFGGMHLCMQMNVSVGAKGKPWVSFLRVCLPFWKFSHWSEALRFSCAVWLGVPGICLYLPRLGFLSMLPQPAFHLRSEDQPFGFLFCNNGNGTQVLTPARQACCHGLTSPAHRGHFAQGVVWK